MSSNLENITIRRTISKVIFEYFHRYLQVYYGLNVSASKIETVLSTRKNTTIDARIFIDRVKIPIVKKDKYVYEAGSIQRFVYEGIHVHLQMRQKWEIAIT